MVFIKVKNKFFMFFFNLQINVLTSMHRMIGYHRSTSDRIAIFTVGLLGNCGQPAKLAA